MSKKILSLVLATLVTSSCFTIKTSATENNLLSRKLIDKPEIFNIEEISSGNGQGTTLDEAMAGNIGKDLVIHKEVRSKIATMSNTPTLREGDISNLVFYAKFKGEDDLLNANFKGSNIKSVFNSMYNDSNISVNQYYNELTQGKLNVKTSFLGGDASATQAIQLDNERGYYMPYSDYNRIGYCPYVVVDEDEKYISDLYSKYEGDIVDTDPSDGIVSEEFLDENPNYSVMYNDFETVYRETKLINEITEKANNSLTSSLSIDKNGDNMIDSAAIIMGVTPDNPIAAEIDWADLLWPHQTSMTYGVSQEEINQLIYSYNLDFSFLDAEGNDVNSKKVGKYNLFTSDFLLDESLEVQSDKGIIGQVGTLCHELGHTFDLPDLYSYNDQSLGCVGTWDLMDNTGVVPQYINSYMRKEAGWLNDNQFVTVDTDGEYELKALANTGSDEIASYVIRIPGNDNQFFFIEYRDAVGAFEGAVTTVDNEYETRNIYESGLVMYRVDTSVTNDWGMLIPGNFDAPPCNIYNLRTEGEAEDKGFRPGVDFVVSAINGVDEHSYGSIDSNIVKNTFAFQDESGNEVENSRVLLHNVRVDGDKMKFSIDAKDPSVINTEVVDGKVVVSFDENLDRIDDSKISLVKDGVNQEVNIEVNEGKVTISLKSGELSGKYTLNLLKESTYDMVGKFITDDYIKEINVGSEVVAVTEVTLDKTEAALKVGENVQLNATVNPSNATNKNVTWTSSDDTVATVDAAGKVVAVKAGEAVITVTTQDGGKTATCNVTVEEDVVVPEVVAVTEVTLDKIEAALKVGENVQLNATVNPSNATNKNVAWTSSDNTVATVDATGKVVAVKAGEAMITVTTQDGGKTATCKVIIEEKPSVDVTPEPDDTDQPGDTDQPDDTNKPGDTTEDGKGELPETGNESPVVPMAVLAIILGGALILKEKKLSV